MGSMSIIHWIILGALALLLFGGRGKISDVMGDVAKGIKSFKKGLADDDEPKPVARPADPMRTLDHYPPQPAPSYAPPPQAAAQPGEVTSEPRKVG